VGDRRRGKTRKEEKKRYGRGREGTGDKNRKPVYPPPFSVMFTPLFTVITPPYGKVPVFTPRNRYFMTFSQTSKFEHKNVD